MECSLCTKPVDGLCMVTRADGKRCTKQRLVGGYCRQHEKLLGGDKGHGAILKSIPVWVPSAVRGWFSAVVSLQQQEDAQFAEACRRSLSGDAGRQDRVRRSREILDGRLVPRGLQRVPTAALGDCLFVAVAQTAGLEITHRSLRAQACDYMDRYREIFARFLDVTTGPFQSFSQYLDWMRVEQHWGDHLVLTAISHLMMRPVHVIRDSVNERNCVQIIKPPEFIAEEVWGPPVTLAYYQDVHYEGTVTVPISPGVQLGAGDAGIQLGDVLLEQAQQATRPPWEVFEQELEVRVGLALRDGSDPVDLLEQDEARKALVSEIGVHRAFHQAGAEVQDHCALQSLREVAAFINCERVGEGHRWAELKFEERLAYGPVDASEMLGPVVVDALAEE